MTHFLRRAEHGSLARRDKSISSHGKTNHESHNQGSLRSSSSTLSTHRSAPEKHGRYIQSIKYVNDLLSKHGRFTLWGFSGVFIRATMKLLDEQTMIF